MCQAEPAPRLVVAVLGLVTAACLLVLLSMLILTLWEGMAGGGAMGGGNAAAVAAAAAAAVGMGEADCSPVEAMAHSLLGLA